jgi:uncharacterized DUF497 family protein
MMVIRERNSACVFGKTTAGRAIFVVFTLRRRGDHILIRPISARYMHGNEVKSYEKENPNL